MVGAVSSTAGREVAELTARAGYLGDILEPMQSAFVHGARSITVDATTSPRVLRSCSMLRT